jgi:hypothetical protein
MVAGESTSRLPATDKQVKKYLIAFELVYADFCK